MTDQSRAPRDGSSETKMREQVAEELWRLIRPLLPPEQPRPRGGRPRVPDHDALAGILFVLRTGIAWENLPQRFGCGSGMTCWRRLREWQQAGAWPKVRQVLEERLDDADGVDWTRAWARAARTRPGRRIARRTQDAVRGAGRLASRQAASEVPRRAWGWDRSEPA
jgi:transposase